MMTNLELTRKVAELLGWENVKRRRPGVYPHRLEGWNPEEGVLQIIPHFTTDLNACEAIWRDERVDDYNHNPLTICLWGRNRLNNCTKRHNGTAEDIARAICEAFIELCEKEKGK